MYRPRAALIAGIAAAACIAGAGEKEFRRMGPQHPEKVIETVQAKTVADSAEKYVGAPYYFGGRNTKKNPGIDCLGLVFLALQDAYGKGWKEWSILPSELIRQVGKGLEKTLLGDKVTAASINSNLRRGDILFFLMPYENRKDVPVRQLECKDGAGKAQTLDLWVWHVAIYAGGGEIIHASPFDGNYCVLKENLYEFYLRNGISGIIWATYR